ncbi:uncharacterized protein LOC135217062 isoform X2 [Macrobrachium nipponense]|uniref:uncharacterized protein LOC135217062 isoform X2 n=1 Tax=Macrobrachium nipponense TaxID=159736 RepID=UPI0030C86245
MAHRLPSPDSVPSLYQHQSLASIGFDKGLLQGPRRVLRLCLFALVIPAVLITIPLYVRLVLYPPGHYPMMPTDQRLIGRHVSGVWCQAQTTHMNGSFNTYMSQGLPNVRGERRRHVMLHTMKMKDDVKEYWGFHLLQGSTVTISSCARWDGGQLMILRGIENLRRCAWIGEEDSAEDMVEDDDIISEERMKIRKQLLREANKHNRNSHEKEEEDEDPRVTGDGQQHSEERRQNIAQLLRKAIEISKDKKEILKILHSEGKNQDYAFHGQLINQETVTENSSGKNKIVNNTLEKDIANEHETLAGEQQGLVHTTEIRAGGFKVVSGVLRDETKRRLKNRTRKGKRKQQRPKKERSGRRRQNTNVTEEALPKEEEETSLRLKRFAEDDESGGAFEDLDDGDILGILETPEKDRGVNETSVEMTVGGKVFYPEGLKFERGKFNQTTLHDRSNEEHRSSYSSSEEALASCDGVIFTLPLVPFRNCHFKNTGLNKITYDIPITGTYYFVFSSDNEIYANDLFFNLTMDRVVYDTEFSETICTNATDCSLPLSFWSNEQAVVEVPEQDDWDHAYVLDTRCEPRVYVYLTLLLLVPLFIMCCAFH